MTSSASQAKACPASTTGKKMGTEMKLFSTHSLTCKDLCKGTKVMYFKAQIQHCGLSFIVRKQLPSVPQSQIAQRILQSSETAPQNLQP